MTHSEEETELIRPGEDNVGPERLAREDEQLMAHQTASGERSGCAQVQDPKQDLDREGEEVRGSQRRRRRCRHGVVVGRETAARQRGRAHLERP